MINKCVKLLPKEDIVSMQGSKAKHQLMAFLLDLVVNYAFLLLIFAAPILILFDAIEDGNESKIFYTSLIMMGLGAIYMLFIIFYFVIVPLLTKGQTLGKMFFKIKVVRVDGKDLDIQTLFLREIIGRVLVDLLTLGLNFIFNFLVVALSKEKRGYHDVLASTRIVDVF